MLKSSNVNIYCTKVKTKLSRICHYTNNEAKFCIDHLLTKYNINIHLIFFRLLVVSVMCFNIKCLIIAIVNKCTGEG